MARIFRFLKALWKFILHGKRVSYDEYVNRLDRCNHCAYLDREKWTCGVCGCYLTKKAQMSTEKCPENGWR